MLFMNFTTGSIRTFLIDGFHKAILREMSFILSCLCWLLWSDSSMQSKPLQEPNISKVLSLLLQRQGQVPWLSFLFCYQGPCLHSSLYFWLTDPCGLLVPTTPPPPPPFFFEEVILKWFTRKEPKARDKKKKTEKKTEKTKNIKQTMKNRKPINIDKKKASGLKELMHHA